MFIVGFFVASMRKKKGVYNPRFANRAGEITMRFATGMCGLLFLLFSCSHGYADEVIFENGERLIGTLQRVEDNKLIFKSEIAGEVSVDISKIKGMYSERPLEILLDDGTLLRGKII